MSTFNWTFHFCVFDFVKCSLPGIFCLWGNWVICCLLPFVVTCACFCFISPFLLSFFFSFLFFFFFWLSFFSTFRPSVVVSTERFVGCDVRGSREHSEAQIYLETPFWAVRSDVIDRVVRYVDLNKFCIVSRETQWLSLFKHRTFSKLFGTKRRIRRIARCAGAFFMPNSENFAGIAGKRDSGTHEYMRKGAWRIVQFVASMRSWQFGGTSAWTI